MYPIFECVRPRPFLRQPASGRSWPRGVEPRRDLAHALRLTLVLVVLCEGAFPLPLSAIGQVVFPYQASGANGHL